MSASGPLVTPTFGFVRLHFPAGDSNLHQFFSADASQTP